MTQEDSRIRFPINKQGVPIYSTSSLCTSSVFVLRRASSTDRRNARSPSGPTSVSLFLQLYCRATSFTSSSAERWNSTSSAPGGATTFYGPVSHWSGLAPLAPSSPFIPSHGHDRFGPSGENLRRRSAFTSRIHSLTMTVKSVDPPTSLGIVRCHHFQL